ncbi:hypothetical protein B0H14DRAFT_2648722, partial [Mycena olivaceomarginata]
MVNGEWRPELGNWNCGLRHWVLVPSWSAPFRRTGIREQDMLDRIHISEDREWRPELGNWNCGSRLGCLCPHGRHRSDAPVSGNKTCYTEFTSAKTVSASNVATVPTEGYRGSGRHPAVVAVVGFIPPAFRPTTPTKPHCATAQHQLSDSCRHILAIRTPDQSTTAQTLRALCRTGADESCNPMPPSGRRPEPLPFLLYAMASLKRKKTIWEPFHCKDNIVYRTPMAETLEKANFPPIWQSACPADAEDLWGAEWDDICSLFDDVDGRFDSTSSTKPEPRDGGPDMDGLVAKQLDQIGRSVREVYNTAVRGEEVEDSWWPGVDVYSGDRDNVLKYLWGSDAVGSKDKKARDRAKLKLGKLLGEVEKLLGVDFLRGSDEAAAKFTTSTLLTALRKLIAASELLGWEVLLPSDYTALEAECSEWTPDKNQEFFDGLTPQAQKHEKIARSLGWMMRMLRNKGSKSKAALYEVEQDLEEYVLAGCKFVHIGMVPTAYELTDRRGAALADSWPERLQAKLADVAAADVVLFAEELRTISSKLWRGGERGLQEWLDGGDDLGVEHHAKLSEEQLDTLLGMQDGWSPVLRRHVAKDAGYYIPGKDEAIPNVTVPVKLRHHQRVAVAAIYQKIINTHNFSTWPAKPKSLPLNALLALHENWGSVPGSGLSDTVGLGKTWTMVLVVAVYIVLYEFQQNESQQNIQAQGPRPGLLTPDADGNWTFGTCKAIPDVPHIIVVPNSLLAQWKLQLERIFVAPAVTIIVVDPKKKKWKESMTVSDNVPKHRRIYLISITTMECGTRMPKPGVSATNNVFGMSYGVLLIDELHELRTGGKNHAAVSALVSASIVK